MTMRRLLKLQKVFRSRWAMAAAVAMLILSVALFALAEPAKKGRVPKPAVGLQVPGCILQAWSRDGSLHFVAMFDTSFSNQKHGFFFEPRFTFRGYHRGLQLNALGFGFGFLPMRYTGSDFVVSPHAGISIPLWFTLAASIGVILYGLYFHHSVRGDPSHAHNAA